MTEQTTHQQKLEDNVSPSKNYFVTVLKKAHPLHLIKNWFFWTGFLWGLPIPVVFLWFHSSITGNGISQLFLSHPIHWFFVVHPLLFGLIFGVVGVFYRHQTNRLKNRAIRDDLTGLYNHRYFRESLRKRISETKRYGGKIGLIMLDIDHFKDVNDQYGHLHGDEILKQLADLLVDTTRASDLVCRYGGEEFAIVLPQTEPGEVQEMAERLRRQVQKYNFDITGELTVSGGAGAFVPDKNKTAEDFIAVVDKQLYRAKDQGRNQICSDFSIDEADSEEEETPRPTDN